MKYSEEFKNKMGFKPAVSNANGYCGGTWMCSLNSHLFKEVDPLMYDQTIKSHNADIHETTGYHDFDHHVFPCSNVIKNGLSYFYEKAALLARETKESGKGGKVTMVVIRLALSNFHWSNGRNSCCVSYIK